MHYKSTNPLKITNLIKNINKYCFDSKNIIELDLLSKSGITSYISDVLVTFRLDKSGDPIFTFD